MREIQHLLDHLTLRRVNELKAGDVLVGQAPLETRCYAKDT
jgi:hypothetical protein